MTEEGEPLKLAVPETYAESEAAERLIAAKQDRYRYRYRDTNYLVPEARISELVLGLKVVRLILANDNGDTTYAGKDARHALALLVLKELLPEL